jgi:hypothetical protein
MGGNKAGARAGVVASEGEVVTVISPRSFSRAAVVAGGGSRARRTTGSMSNPDF